MLTASQGLFAKGTVNGRIETLCLCKQHYKSWTAASVCCHTDDETEKRGTHGKCPHNKAHWLFVLHVCVYFECSAPLLAHIPPLRIPRLWALFLAEFSFLYIYSQTMYYLCFQVQRSFLGCMCGLRKNSRCCCCGRDRSETFMGRDLRGDSGGQNIIEVINKWVMVLCLWYFQSDLMIVLIGQWHQLATDTYHQHYTVASAVKRKSLLSSKCEVTSLKQCGK